MVVTCELACALMTWIRSLDRSPCMDWAETKRAVGPKTTASWSSARVQVSDPSPKSKSVADF